MSPPELAGRFFDGRTTAAVPATVEIAGGEVRVARGDGAPGLSVPLRDVRVTEGFGAAPRQLVFPGGTMVEVAEGAALAAALAGAGRRMARGTHDGWACPPRATATPVRVPGDDTEKR